MKFKKGDVVKVIKNESTNKQLDFFINKLGKIVDTHQDKPWPYLIDFNTHILPWGLPNDSVKFEDKELRKATDKEKQKYEEERVENEI